MPDTRHSLADNRTLMKALADRRPATVPEVITVLDAIRKLADQLPADPTDPAHRDGIACFSDLYHQITTDVLASYDAGTLFSRSPFILQLDVAFAMRYLRALSSYLADDSPPPGCWRVLFDKRQERHEAWQFAVVGVNAHVNFDLAFALLDVWEANETPLASTTAQFSDYQAINTIFRNRMDELCEKNEVPWTRWGPDGGIVDGIGNFVGGLLVTGTRDVAWTFAELMWAQRGKEGYRIAPTSVLDTLATGIAQAFL